jgi:hypothetical protein
MRPSGSDGVALRFFDNPRSVPLKDFFFPPYLYRVVINQLWKVKETIAKDVIHF